MGEMLATNMRATVTICVLLSCSAIVASHSESLASELFPLGSSRSHGQNGMVSDGKFLSSPMTFYSVNAVGNVSVPLLKKVQRAVKNAKNSCPISRPVKLVFHAPTVGQPLPKCFEHRSEPKVSQNEADDFFQGEANPDSSTSVTSQHNVVHNEETRENANNEQTEKQALDEDSLKRRWLLGGAGRPWPNGQMYDDFEAYSAQFEDWESEIFAEWKNMGESPEHFQQEDGSSDNGDDRQHSLASEDDQSSFTSDDDAQKSSEQIED